MTRELAQQKEEMERAQRKFERESQENRLIYDQKIRGVEGDLNTLKSNQDVMARTFSDEKLEYDKKFLAVQDEKKKVLAENETLKKKMTQQEDTNRKLQQDNQKNQKEEIVIRDLREQVRQLTYQLSATERFGNERKSAADTMRQAADMATLQKKHDEETKRQKDDNVRLTGELSKLNEEVRKLNEDKQKRDKETSALKIQYEGAQKRVDEVKKSNSQLLKDLNTKCKTLENENRSLKKSAGLPVSESSFLSLKSPSLEAALQEIDSSSRKDVVEENE